MARMSVEGLGTPAIELPRTQKGSDTVYHLSEWKYLTHPQRLSVMREIAQRRGRDHTIARRAVAIVGTAAQPREYRKQAAALLKWVQNPRNCYYANEAGERLQDPLYTLKAKHGDCDDLCLLLASFYESIALPWRFVLSGLDSRGNKVRYIEGDAVPPGCRWTHIYLMVGIPVFNPRYWYFAEPTIQGVPLGWDVLQGDRGFLPELEKYTGPQRVMPSPLAGPWHRRSRQKDMPEALQEELYGSALVGTVAGSVASTVEDEGFDWKRIGVGIMTGVAVAVGTQLTLDWIRGTGVWQGKGPVTARLNSFLEGA